MRKKMTHKEMAEYYSELQSTKDYGTATGDTLRHNQILDFILNNIPTNQKFSDEKIHFLLSQNYKINNKTTIFDASCGRGNLISELMIAGYNASGSESSPWLLENELKDLPVRKLFYSELDQLEPESYNVVISTDVLEHLFNEKEIRMAMINLCGISKKWVLITVGLNRAQRIIDNKKVKLHYVVESPSWWSSLYKDYCSVVKEFMFRNSYCMFGKKLWKF